MSIQSKNENNSKITSKLENQLVFASRTWGTKVRYLLWTNESCFEVKFCQLMSPVQNEQVEGLGKAFTENATDMDQLYETIGHLYAHALPSTVSSSVSVSKDENETVVLTPIPALLSIVPFFSLYDIFV